MFESNGDSRNALGRFTCRISRAARSVTAGNLMRNLALGFAVLLLVGLSTSFFAGLAEAQGSRTFSISSDVAAGEGGDASLTITLGQDAPTDGLEFSVTPTYSSGTDSAAAADVANLPTTVSVSEGARSATLKIALAHDQVEESDETFTVVIATGTTGWSVASDGADTATVTIQDRTVVVNFAQTAYTVTEGSDHALTIALHLSRNPGRDALINVNLTSGDETIRYGIQIDATDADAVEKHLFNLSDNDVAQATRLYTLSLEVPESAQSAGFVTGADAAATVTIHDDDPLADLQATSGDGQLRLAWTAPVGTVTGYDMQYKERGASNEPATTPNDPSTGWVDAGHIGATPSHVIEGLKNNLRHQVRVRSANNLGSGPWTNTGGVPTTDQPYGKPTLEFSLQGVENHCWVDEGDHQDYPVDLSHALPVDTTVKIRVADDSLMNTATETEDYTLSTRMLTIPAYATVWDRPSVRVYARADRKSEGPEYIVLELVPVNGAPYTLGDRKTTTACISDTSVSPGLNISASTGSAPVSEGSTVQVTVRLDQPALRGGALVELIVTGQSTATRGRSGDFTVSNRLMRIPEGQDYGTATLTIIDDGQAEVNETIDLRAFSVNPRLVTGSDFSITIAGDSTAPTVSEAIADATIVSESRMHEASLSGVFADAEGHALTITASSSDKDVATVSVSADYSSLTVTAKARGTATITVIADDGTGGTVETTFTVAVKAAPVVASALADVSGLEVGATREISLSGVFSDPDGDSLTVTASSSSNAVVKVSAALDGSGLTLVAEDEGTATVTVTAQDSDGNRASDEFEVSVVQDPDQGQQRAAEPPGPVLNLQLEATADGVRVSWDAPDTGGAPVGYIVHVRPEDGGKGRTKTPKAKKTAVSFKNLEPGRTYKVWVRGQNGHGKGERVRASITLPGEGQEQ